MSIVKASVKIKGLKVALSSEALADTGARMTILDTGLADKVGVEYTGRKITFISISGQVVEASEAVVSEFTIEGETLKYEAIAVAKIPDRVKETLVKSELDPNVIVGLLTLERANLLPDTTTGKIKKVESFILYSPHLPVTPCIRMAMS